MGGRAMRLYWPIRSPNSVEIICFLATSFWRKDGRITNQQTKRACHILLGGKWLIRTEAWGSQQLEGSLKISGRGYMCWWLVWNTKPWDATWETMYEHSILVSYMTKFGVSFIISNNVTWCCCKFSWQKQGKDWPWQAKEQTQWLHLEQWQGNCVRVLCKIRKEGLFR